MFGNSRTQGSGKTALTFGWVVGRGGSGRVGPSVDEPFSEVSSAATVHCTYAR